MASLLNNLAILYRAMGQSAKAEPLFLYARDIFEQTLGPEHAATTLPITGLQPLEGFTLYGLSAEHLGNERFSSLDFSAHAPVPLSFSA